MAGQGNRGKRALGCIMRLGMWAGVLAGCLSLGMGASSAQTGVSPGPKVFPTPKSPSSRPMPQNPTPTTAGRSYSTPTRRDFGYYDHNFELLDVDQAARSHGTQTLTRTKPPASPLPKPGSPASTSEEITAMVPTPPTEPSQSGNALQPTGPPRQTEFTFWDGSVLKGRILSFDGTTYIIALPFGQLTERADRFAQVKTLPLFVPGLTSKQLAVNPLVRRMTATVPTKAAGKAPARAVPNYSASAKAPTGTTHGNR